MRTILMILWSLITVSTSETSYISKPFDCSMYYRNKYASDYNKVKKDYVNFKKLLFKTESTCNYNIVHSSGAMGGYGFTSQTLRSLGIFLTPDSFRLFPYLFPMELQEVLLDRLIKRNYSILYTIIKDNKGKVLNDSIMVTECGILAAAHLAGPGGVIEFFKNGTNPQDSNGTSILTYLKLFENTRL